MAAMLASCGSDEPTVTATSGEIRFVGLTQQPLSRSEQLPADYYMLVQALHHAGDTHYLFFDDPAEFVFDAATSVWKGAACDYYYPPVGTMDFVAFAVKDKANHMPSVTYTTTADKIAFTGMTLDFGTSLDGTDPIVISDLQTGDCGTAAELLPLQFRYALSKVRFFIRTLDLKTSQNLILHSLKVKDLGFSGVANITPARTTVVGTSQIGSEVEWGTTANVKDCYLIPESSNVYPTYVTSAEQPGAQAGSDMYLPSQSTSATTITLEAQFTFLNTPSDTESRVYTKEITLPAIKWLPGTQYTYTLTCTLTEIGLSTTAGAMVEEWHKEEIISM